jgi:hypothetical protein
MVTVFAVLDEARRGRRFRGGRKAMGEKVDFYKRMGERWE